MNPAFPFGVIVPGRPLIAAFTPVGDGSRAIAVLESPKDVTEICFFMTSALPEGMGALLHFAVPPFTNWEIIGAIGPGKPSGIFRTGFRVREDVCLQPALQIGISYEPLATLDNLAISTTGVEDRIGTANKIAMDLFNYMTSFSGSGSSGGSALVVPTSAFDEWIKRFERKSLIDPNFFQKL